MLKNRWLPHILSEPLSTPKFLTHSTQKVVFSSDTMKKKRERKEKEKEKKKEEGGKKPPKNQTITYCQVGISCFLIMKITHETP